MSADLVVLIHDAVLNHGELAGLARDKSLAGALGRVDNRLAYGMIADPFELATSYAAAIAQGHCFNDGNKRTAFQTMDVSLDLHGVEIDWTVMQIGPRIIALAQGQLDPLDLADWLRGQAPLTS